MYYLFWQYFFIYKLFYYNCRARETHQIAEAQREKNAKLREAFNISDGFVDGSSFSADRKVFTGHLKKNWSNTLGDDTINNTGTIKSVLNNNNNMETESNELSKKRTYSSTSLKHQTKDTFYSGNDDAKLTDAASKDNSVGEHEHVYKKKKKKRAHER